MKFYHNKENFSCTNILNISFSLAGDDAFNNGMMNYAGIMFMLTTNWAAQVSDVLDNLEEVEQTFKATNACLILKYVFF